ncbi:MAG: succinate dehydrogenase, hydrophobic membrane anchor protein [Rhodobacteraceae bacterium]|nr:succinate dehydrogenase, hydrophobic membrane anchor protein [Paracoccaceae bacterium]
MSLKTPRSRVMGLGSAKDGVEHWWSQRVTSVALVPLTILFVVPFATVIGEGYDAMRSLYANPFNAVVAILFIGVSFLHLAQGLQVVIEDYVHDKGARTTLLLTNTLSCGLLGVAGVFAVAKIAFGV